MDQPSEIEGSHGSLMKQVVQSYKTGEIRLCEVPPPKLKAGGVLVRNARSLISIGTERLMIETGRKSLIGKAAARPDLVRRAIEKAKKEGVPAVWREAMNRLDEPVPLGYSSCGEVIGVGAGVTGFSIGDRVACAGAGFASHAEEVWVPMNLCVKVPEQVGWDEAAFCMVGAIALHGIRSASLEFGETVAVVGLGLLGLLTVQMLEAYSIRVIGIDIDPQKVDLAKTLGITQGLVIGRDAILDAVQAATQDRGCDAVIVTASSRDRSPIQTAESVCRRRGRIVLVGVADISLDRKTFWEKELGFTVSKAAGPGSLEESYEVQGRDYPPEQVRWTEKRNLEHVLDLIARKRIALQPLLTHRFSIHEAPAAYERILSGRERAIGALFEYGASGAAGRPTATGATVVLRQAGEPSNGPAVVGVIGGGPFSKNILLPHLQRVRGVRLKGIATTRGVGSHHLGTKFGFEYCTTRHEDILTDPDIESVLILTRHHEHAPLVLEALRHGKHVFVEKPLCLNEQELAEIVARYASVDRPALRLRVGFNRTASPQAQALKHEVDRRPGPVVMTYRVNAGFIPADHWVHDPSTGGGRIIGEICHFIDFMAFMADANPVSVFTQGILVTNGKYAREDNVILTVRFKDGSIGTIVYTSQGSKAYSRERFELFSGETVIMLDDFRRATITRDGCTRKLHRWSQELGYREELEAFLRPEPADPASAFQRAVSVTLASFKAVESLQRGAPVPVQPIGEEETP